MNDFAKALQPIFAARPLKEDEYMDEASGLVYCQKCHTPRQTNVVIGGAPVLAPCMCSCQNEAYLQEKAEKAERDRQMRIARLREDGLQDKALRDYTFANDNGLNPEMQWAHRYVEQWPKMRRNASGLLLWGDVGTGKSYFAGCIANDLLDRGVSVVMTNFATILNTLTGLYTANRSCYLDRLNACSLLIIDDLGVERSTEFAMEQAFAVIDARYRTKLPMIVTTNLTLEYMKAPPDLAHARIYDRILERCLPLKISNQNIREINREANLITAKALLSDRSAPAVAPKTAEIATKIHGERNCE